MKSRFHTYLLSALFVLTVGAVAILLPAGSAPQAAPSSPAENQLAAYQAELLDIAFKASSALPVNPHLKTRSRLQEEVADACLALDQPERALPIVEAVGNWRRGTGYADLACYFAKHNDARKAQHYIGLAQHVCETSENEAIEGENSQTWRKDRIIAAIARAEITLGKLEHAAQLEAGLASSETVAVNEAKARLADAQAFDAEIKVLDTVLLTGDFDRVRGELEVFAQFFDRFYADDARRALAEEKIKSSWKKLPLMIHIELMFELTGFALDHADQTKARALISETQTIVDSAEWLPEDRIPLMSRLAAFTHRAGDVQGARAAIDATVAMFDAKREQIVDIYRAKIMRSVAEAYQAMGETKAARNLYARAVEEGIANPNSRPRAEDLSATCCSMALHGVEPDAELWARVRKISAELKAPW